MQIQNYIVVIIEVNLMFRAILSNAVVVLFHSTFFLIFFWRGGGGGWETAINFLLNIIVSSNIYKERWKLQTTM